MSQILAPLFLQIALKLDVVTPNRRAPRKQTIFVILLLARLEFAVMETSAPFVHHSKLAILQALPISANLSLVVALDACTQPNLVHQRLQLVNNRLAFHQTELVFSSTHVETMLVCKVLVILLPGYVSI